MPTKATKPMSKDSGPIKSAANDHNNAKNPLSQRKNGK